MPEKQNHYESNPFKVIFNGFSNFFNVNQAMAIVILVMGLVGVVFEFFNFMAQTVFNAALESSAGATHTSSAYTSSSSETDPVVAAVIIVFFVLFFATMWIGIFALQTIYRGMVAYATVKTGENKTITIGDAFKKSISKFWTLVWLQFVVFFKVFGGTLLLIVPGVRAALRYDMAMLPVFSEDTDTKGAITTSKKITKNHLMEILGMSFAAGIIPFVGGLMKAGGQSVMFPQLVAVSEGKMKAPKTHWLNYLVFIIIGSFALLIILVAVLVAVIANAS